MRVLSIPILVLLAFVVCQNVQGDEVLLENSDSYLITEEQGKIRVEESVISLEYKPIRPSYLGSGSNVAQIIPPGKPWPASPEGYANFSQLNTEVFEVKDDDDIPVFQSAGAPQRGIVNLDMSNPSKNLADSLEEVLAPELANVKITDQQQIISISLNIKPPPDATMAFIKQLQESVRTAIERLVPYVGTQLKIAITKSSTGKILKVKAYLKIVVPSADNKIVLPPSNVPEIDLTKSTSGLAQSLKVILTDELNKAGYKADSSSVQVFSLSFSILPPDGATKDYVKLEVLRPLLNVLKGIAPRLAITGISVKTSESGKKILRQTVKVSVRINPQAQPTTTTPKAVTIENRNNFQEDETQNENVVPKNAIVTEVIDLTTPQAKVDNIRKILEDAISPSSNPSDDGKPKILAIPFMMKPPETATPEQFQEKVVEPLRKLLIMLEPTGVVVSTKTKVFPDGKVELVVVFEIPSVKDSKTYKDLEANRQKPTEATQEPVTKETQTEEPKTTPSSKGETEAPQNENEGIPKNAVLISPIEVNNFNSEFISDLEKKIDEVSTNSDKPQVIGIPFVMSKKSFLIETGLKQLLKMINIGKILPETQTKKLPNGKIEYIIFIEKPTVEEQTKPSVEEKKPESREPIGSSTALPETSEVTSEVTNTENEEEPENAILIPPIDLKNKVDYETLPKRILQEVDEVSKSNNGKPQVIGIPFIMPQKSIFQEIALKKGLEMILPGNVLPKTKTKKLPNGDVEYIVYVEQPATKKPTEGTVEEQTKPSVQEETQESRESASSTVAPETSEVPKTENEEEPENAILIPPIDLKKRIDYENLPEIIRREVDEVSKPTNGKPQVIGIPFIMSKKSLLVEIALKNLLQVVVPGEVLPKTKTKKLPNGDVEYIVYVEKPATKKTTEEPVEEQTKPSVQEETQESRESASSTVAPETSEVPKTANEEELENAILIPPIDLKNKIDYQTLPELIRREVDEVSKPNNGKPQIIGIPLIMPKKGLSYFEGLALKKMLQTFLPGEVLPKTKTKKLPNGDDEYIIYVKKPATTTEGESQEITKPSVEENNQDIVFPTPETAEPPETSATPETPTQPEDVIMAKPILLEPFSFETIKDGIEERIEELYKTTDGEKKLVGLPFILPKEHSSTLLIYALENMLKILLPGNNLPMPQTKVLPNGDTEVIYYYELPPRKKVENLEEKQPVFEVDVDLDKPDASIPGEVSKALIRGVYKDFLNPENKGKPLTLKLKVYTPKKNSVSENEEVINLVSEQVKKLEPSAKVISAKAIPDRQSYEPDGVVEVEIPSIDDSNSLLLIKNALKIPTIDMTALESPLEDTIKILLEKGLKSLGEDNPKGSQLFELSFKLDPYDLKGSRHKALEALKAAELKGLIVSAKVSSRPDGLDYLDVCFLIPKVEDSIIIEIIRGQRPEVVQEAIVSIDTQNPRNKLLIQVIREVNGAVDQVRGAQKNQLVDLPLNFRFTNSDGMSDSRVSEVISRTLPYIKKYISQALPEGKVLSVETIGVPDSDDVILKIMVRTPYQPDNKIIIEVQRDSRARRPKPRSRSLFDL